MSIWLAFTVIGMWAAMLIGLLVVWLMPRQGRSWSTTAAMLGLLARRRGKQPTVS